MNRADIILLSKPFFLIYRLFNYPLEHNQAKPQYDKETDSTTK